MSHVAINLEELIGKTVRNGTSAGTVIGYYANSDNRSVIVYFVSDSTGCILDCPINYLSVVQG